MKLRIWDKKEKKMYYPNENKKWYYCNEYGTLSIPFDIDNLKFAEGEERYEVMYGFDIEGVDVYFGDVVNMCYEDDYIITVDGLVELYTLLDRYYGCGDDLVVLGNIKENNLEELIG
ncbi:MAG: hypothetical protein ACOCZ5_01930 [bacterium]